MAIVISVQLGYVGRYTNREESEVLTAGLWAVGGSVGCVLALTTMLCEHADGSDVPRNVRDCSLFAGTLPAGTRTFMPDRLMLFGLRGSLLLEYLNCWSTIVLPADVRHDCCSKSGGSSVVSIGSWGDGEGDGSGLSSSSTSLRISERSSSGPDA